MSSPRRAPRLLRVPHRLFRLLGRDDRGAVGVLVGVLLGFGGLLGMGAFVIDVGQLYHERAELQNGADAAALAIAKSCAASSCTNSAGQLLAKKYANANANDGSSAVTEVCGSPSSLGTCLPPETDEDGELLGYECPEPPEAPRNYVDVHTATGSDVTKTLLPPVFARALIGPGSDDGNTVLACSRAAWGAPSAAWTAAFTISACEWDAATSQGTVYAAPPPYPPNTPPSSSYSRVLKLHGSSASPTCPTRPSGSDGPGMFGWTDADEADDDADVDHGNCSVHVSGNTYSSDPGVSASGACKADLAAARAARSVIYIPIYRTVTGSGTNGTYTLEGFAAFVVTGYSLPGFQATDWLNPANDCRGSDKCINGYFTRGLIPNAEMGDASAVNMGAVTTALFG